MAINKRNGYEYTNIAEDYTGSPITLGQYTLVAIG